MTVEELMEASATEREVLHRLRQNGELSQNQLATLVGGKRVTVIAVANRLVDEGKLSCRAGKRGAKLYDIARADPDEPEQVSQPEVRAEWLPDVREQVATRSTVVEAGFGCCLRCDAFLVAPGSFCDPCALLSRQDAGLGG
jgi:hypothetical protein